MFGHELLENEYVSDDFELHGEQYLFPLTYLIRNNVKAGDEVVVITAVEKGDVNHCVARDNYEKYKSEVKSIADKLNVNIEFKEIWTDDEFTVAANRDFFKNVVRLIRDDDIIYADLTFGIKIFSVSQFIALAYVARANKNVEIKHIIYAWKYSSMVETKNAKESKIYDVTSLFFLNEIAGKLSAGDRSAMDKMLGI